MAWPTRTWTVDGWKDFKPPLEGRRPEGVPADWEDHKWKGDSMTYWDVLDNPLYEAAAEASGINWTKWVAESMDDIGLEEDYEFPESSGRRMVRYVKQGGGFGYMPYNATGGAYHEIDDSRLAGTPWAEMGPISTMAGTFGKKEDGPNPRAWGISRSKHGNFIEDLDEMRGWLAETIKVFDMQDAPIIRRGPEGSDYGIEGDIWAFYGLDKPPAAPKEMDVHYAFNLTPFRSSNVRYETPEGYPVLDLGHEGQAGFTTPLPA